MAGSDGSGIKELIIEAGAVNSGGVEDVDGVEIMARVLEGDERIELSAVFIGALEEDDLLAGVTDSNPEPVVGKVSVN